MTLPQLLNITNKKKKKKRERERERKIISVLKKQKLHCLDYD